MASKPVLKYYLPETLTRYRTNAHTAEHNDEPTRSSTTSPLSNVQYPALKTHIATIAYLCALSAAVFTSTSSNANTDQSIELMVVDCLLPGQVRRLGSLTYIAARKAIKTSAKECEQRGGEYVVSGRANFASTIRVWLPIAEKGDAQAQAYIGEAYEKQLATTAHNEDTAYGYSAAAQWYMKAAEQGHSGAAINLGNLFEHGLGVNQDARMAQFWYQRAAGLHVPRDTQANAQPEPQSTTHTKPTTQNTSRYQALVIGNNRYLELPELDTAVSDAEAIAKVLQERYGFGVRLLIDANRYEVLSALHQLKDTFGVETRLLIYYAGHGELDRVNRRGHWLPIDAAPDNSTNWISNVAITDFLNILPASQLMVVADSCYSGMMSRSALGVLDQSMSKLERKELLQSLNTAKTRTVFTSGGVAPVIDGLGGAHSVFARELIHALSENTDTLTGFELFNKVAPRVTKAAADVGFTQIPEYAPLKFSGHEAGDFVFRPI